jgi:hypothetical protein
MSLCLPPPPNSPSLAPGTQMCSWKNYAEWFHWHSSQTTPLPTAARTSALSRKQVGLSGEGGGGWWASLASRKPPEKVLPLACDLNMTLASWTSLGTHLLIQKDQSSS